MITRRKIKITNWWLELTIAEKFTAFFVLLLIIGMLQTGATIIGFQTINQSINAAQTSLDAQRLSLEISRDWQSMQYYKYRFFSEYDDVGYVSAKERFAIPAGEKLSSVIRTGAELRRMTSAADASDNLKKYDPVLQKFLLDISQYTTELEFAVGLASDPENSQQGEIQSVLDELEILDRSIEPNFTLMILMAQNEVFLAKDEIARTQRTVSILLLMANIVAVALAFLVVIAFRRTISDSVRRLTNASTRMQKGHLDERVEIPAKDEFGMIGSAFNKMAQAVQERTEQLRETDFRYQALFNQSTDAVFLVGLNGEIKNVNQRTLSMFGFNSSEMIGKNIQTLMLPEDAEKTQNELNRLRTGEDIPVFERTMKKKDGSTFSVEINITRVLNESGQPLYYQVISRDVSERKEMEAQLRYMAMFDSLTGLPNRTNLYVRLIRAIENAQLSKQHVAVLYLDLDGFKQVNDRFGHEKGDWLLVQIGEKLQSAVRNSDLVARVGGDEFIIILENIIKPEYAAQVAEKILTVLSEPIEINGEQAVISTSIGISLYPGDGTDIEVLIKHADEAMYHVKGNKKNGYKFHFQK